MSAAPAPGGARLLVIMGSGETSPTMVTTHRRLLERLGPPPVPAVLLDTPFGFQANVDVLARRAVDYFRDSVGLDIDVATWRSAAEATSVDGERSLARLRAARYVFAGPGSPSYALRQWAGSPVPDLLADKLTGGGCVTFASAAALTLGATTVPVYEIYKVGAEPRWLDGLDLLRVAGLPGVAVIPHYDNAEGGNHDTRYCYLGEGRLDALERQLPDEAFVLGVDEHTGVILDLDQASATVVGRGGLTVRHRGHSEVFPAGTTVDVAELRAAGRPGGGTRGAPRSAPVPESRPEDPAEPAASLVDTVRALEARFDAAIAERDVDDAVACVLDVEQAMVAWSGDSLQSDHARTARATLRRMVVRLGELATAGSHDPEATVRPLVEALVEARAAARRGGDWATADAVRDRLLDAGVEISDTPEGTRWRLLT